MQYISDFLNGTKDDDGTVLSSGFKGPTLLGYRAAIFAFIDSRYGVVRKKKDSTPEERMQYEKFAKKYLQGKVSPLVDLKGYKDYLTKLKRPPHSISQGVTCVRIWLEHYGHELSSKDMRELKKHMPSQRTGVTREGELSPDIVKTILSHTADTRLKAAILVMLTSGVRVGELAKLTIDDVDLKKNSIYISDMIAKSGVTRITFFTDEARDALVAYLKERDKYIAQAKKFTPRLGQQYQESDLLFPITTNVFRTTMNAALKKAGLHQIDKRTNRANVHPHSLRKYFSSTLKLAGMPEDICEVLMGHGTQISTAYRVYSDKQLREQYQKFSFCLDVNYAYTEQKELRSQLDELKTENTTLLERLKQVEQGQTEQAIRERANLSEMIRAEVERTMAMKK